MADLSYVEKFYEDEAMRLIIFGPPGSGKGTYALRLEPELGITKISTGDIFREIAKQDTVLGRKVASYLERGELVPDDIVIEILRERIKRIKGGFILDGYPRTMAQADALEGIAKIDAVINLLVPDEVIIDRLSTRRICRSCGEIFNIKYLKPKVEGICDKCGGELYQREDDRPEVIRERLRIYRERSEPLIEYYKKRVPFINIKCNRADIPPEVVVERILKKLKKLASKIKLTA